MSNGLTSVVISTLVLAASALAQTDRQRELAVWFASHDQGVFGLGMVGLDVSDLPWRADTFEADRTMRRTITDQRNRFRSRVGSFGGHELTSSDSRLMSSGLVRCRSKPACSAIDFASGPP